MKKFLTEILTPIILVLMLIGPPTAAILAAMNHPKTEISTPTPKPPVNTPDVPNNPTKTTIVQFSSHATIKEAQNALVSLQSGGLFDITDVRLYKAVLPNGTWYRVAIPVKDLSAGNKLCDAWKAKGNDCLVLQFT